MQYYLRITLQLKLWETSFCMWLLSKALQRLPQNREIGRFLLLRGVTMLPEDEMESWSNLLEEISKQSEISEILQLPTEARVSVRAPGVAAEQ